MNFKLWLMLFCFYACPAIAKTQDTSFYFKTSDNVKLYVHVAGKGMACLFIHGGPGLTSYYFEALPAAKLLQQKLQMIYFDQRGSGRSSTPADSNYSMKRMEQDVEELRVFLKIKKWSVMGHSFGGLLMTAYAKDYPKQISCLLYVHCAFDLNTTLRSHIDNGLRLLRDVGDTIQADKSLSLFNQMMQVHAELSKKKIEYKIMHPSQRENDLSDSLTDAATKNFNQDYAHHVWALKDYWINYSTYTSQIDIPTLAIFGDSDYAIGPETYKSIHFPRMKIAMYHGGHYSFQEQPEWFAKQVTKFIDEQRIR